ncbi:hypothetical protein OG803_38535 (plasmid) [Streptomyces sp. NBC_00467]
MFAGQMELIEVAVLTGAGDAGDPMRGSAEPVAAPEVQSAIGAD